MQKVADFSEDIWQLEVPNIQQHLEYFVPYVDALVDHGPVRHDYMAANYELPPDLTQTILGACASISGEEGLVVRDYWLQDYRLDNYHGTHTHGNAIVSGVYYLRYEGHGAPIVFLDKNKKEKLIEPARGMMILFGGHVPHRVPPVPETVTERSVLAFNVHLAN